MQAKHPPVILDVALVRGATLGADLARLRVRHAGPNLHVVIGDRPVAVQRRQDCGDEAIVWLAMPPRVEDDVRIVVQNTTPGGAVMVGFRAEVDGPHRTLGAGGDQTVRITRALLQSFKRYGAPAARLAHVTTFDDAPDGVRLLPIADAPVLAVAGPRLNLDPLRLGRPAVETWVTPDGVRRVESGAALVADLLYDLTGTAHRAPDLLALMASLATYVARTRWLELPRSTAPAAPLVRWDLETDGLYQAQVGRDGVHAFTTRLRVRDVALDDVAASTDAPAVPVGGMP